LAISLAMPICKIKAMNKIPRMRLVDVDNLYKLLNVLSLCFNSRKSISTNLKIGHGLINGTRGAVNDIILI
jgi:hypothetical protein